MRNLKILAILLVSAVMFTGCGVKNKEAIVKVNDSVITQADYDELFNQTAKNPALKALGLDAKKVDKKGFMYVMIKDKVINELIIKTLIQDEIKKRHITVTNKDTEEALNKIIDEVGSKQKFNAVLKGYGVSLAEFKKDLAEEVKMKKLVDMLEKVNITEADAKKYYNANLSKFSYPDKVRASHILVLANADELTELTKAEPKNENLSEAEIKKLVDEQMAEKLKRAKELLAQVKKDSTTFAKVAKENSEDVESAKQGGDLGFFAKQEMVESFANAAFSMKPNTISDIVVSPYGYHIIMVTDRKAAGQDSFEKVKQDIISYLENEKKVKVLENFVETLKKTAKIEYLNPEYNPTDIQETLQQYAKENAGLSAQPKDEKAETEQVSEKK